MDKLVIGGVVTLVVTLVAQAAARGGLRRRNLTTAGHELDVAAKLAEDSPLRAALELLARQRLLRYTQPPTDKTVRRLTRLGVVFLGLVVFVGLALLAYPKVPAWVFVLPGIVVGFFMDTAENAVVRHVERRRMHREQQLQG